MIEKYFQAGVRLKWSKPHDAVGGALDGSIVDTVHRATPMVYDGMDDQVVNLGLNATALRALGLTVGRPMQYAWLDYAPGRTARVPIGPYDVLTGYMSGCIIAYWMDKGVRYAGHIGTIDGNGAVNRVVKRTFSFAMPKSAKGFNPAGAWHRGEIQGVLGRRAASARVFGIVTTHGNFHSVLMSYVANGEWCVGGIKAVPAIPHDTLKLQLLRND